MQVLCWLLLSVGGAWGFAGDFGDTLSAVQGMIRTHQRASIEGASCAQLGEESEELLDFHLAGRAELVVIRGAGEDLRWLDRFAEIPTVVYDRNGLDVLLPKSRPNLRVIAQDNTGRQDAGMLNHIIENYESLAEITFFLQGWPFWQCAGAMQEIRRVLRNVDSPADAALLNNGALPGLVPLTSSFSQYSIAKGALGSWLSLITGDRSYAHMSKEEQTRYVIRNYNSTCTRVLNRTCSNTHWVSEGAQWAVSRSRIQANPKSYYEGLRNMVIIGDEVARTRLRSIVLEAQWPTIFGARDWSPGRAGTIALRRRGFASAQSADAHGNFCVFTSERGNTGSIGERRAVCELEKRSRGINSDVISVDADGRLDMALQMRIVPTYRISSEMVAAGAASELVIPPAATTYCSKKHVWPVSIATRIKNKDSGTCVQLTEEGFALVQCTEADAQMMHLVSKANGGFYQILDSTEQACISHNFASASDRSNKCKMGTDGGAFEDQKWDFVDRGGSYQIRMKGTSYCIVQRDLRLELAGCDWPGSLWDLPDLANSGQYLQKFEFALTQFQDGKIKMRCTTRLHSDDDQASLDVVEPNWRKRGSIVAFDVKEAPEGMYYLMDRTAPDVARYLGCNKTTREASFISTPTAWKIHPVSHAFVFLEANNQVLQFFPATGTVRCSLMPLNGGPPQDTAFALEFVKLPYIPLPQQPLLPQQLSQPQQPLRPQQPLQPKELPQPAAAAQRPQLAPGQPQEQEEEVS